MRLRRCSVENMHGEGSGGRLGTGADFSGREMERSMQAFVDGIVAGYGGARPVVAVGMRVGGAAMRAGFRYGFRAGAGAATADLLYALVAAAAGSVTAARLEPWSAQIRAVSAAVLAAIAVWGLVGIRR